MDNENTKGVWIWLFPGLLFSILGYIAVYFFKHRNSEERLKLARIWAGVGVAVNTALVWLGFSRYFDIPAKIMGLVGGLLFLYAVGCTIYLVVLRPLGSLPKALKKLKSFHDSTKME